MEELKNILNNKKITVTSLLVIVISIFLYLNKFQERMSQIEKRLVKLETKIDLVLQNKNIHLTRNDLKYGK